MQHAYVHSSPAYAAYVRSTGTAVFCFDRLQSTQTRGVKQPTRQSERPPSQPRQSIAESADYSYGCADAPMRRWDPKSVAARLACVN